MGSWLQMTVIRGDTGKVSVGTMKTFTLTQGTVTETLLSTPVTLPLTEPTTAQISLTVQNTDLFTISPIVPMKNFAVVVCSGKCPTAAQISYRLVKNGVSVSQVNNATTVANNFWTHTYNSFGEVSSGDVLEVKLWSTQADSYVDFYGMFMSPSQPEVAKRGTLLKDLSFIVPSSSPFSATMNMSNAGSCILYPSSNTTTSMNVSQGTSFLYICPHLNYGLFRSPQGDASSGPYTQNSASTRNYQKTAYPTTITFREINL